MRFFSDHSARELVERLRDDLVELLSRKTGGHLNKSVDGVSGGAAHAADTHRAASELAERGIPTGSRAVDRSPVSTSSELETPTPVTGSRSDEPVSGRSEHFVLRLTQEDRSSFASLADRLSLSCMLREVKNFAAHDEIRRGTPFSASEKRLIGLLDKMQAQQGGKLEDSNLEFRWVRADRELAVPKLVEDARVNGGADPSVPWTHIGSNVVQDIMAAGRDPGVLFIYDGDKLRTVPKEEISADPGNKNMYAHAVKPVAGLELKDTLLGMIRFDASGEDKYGAV